jgi:geranylgeranyl diphosphate synthase, type I
MTGYTSSPFIKELREATDQEMRRILSKELLPDYKDLHEMMIYHLGWSGDGVSGDAVGKRLRPIFLLLCAQAAGGDWVEALPAAASVELLHNFSLIHDDIQDKSPIRHGRESVWKKWNVSLAINAGDTMFSLANLAMLDLDQRKTPEIVLQAQKCLLQTCVQLTHGQHLDISNETKTDIDLDSYWSMIGGKTAALLGASMKIGVITAGKGVEIQDAAYQFGYSTGLAFQVVDDILGIWGETALTGKSKDSDLMSRKLSLPILYGIKQNKRFAERWKQDNFQMDEIPDLAQLLLDEGAKEYSEKMANKFTDDALLRYEMTGFHNEAAILVKDICESLVLRNY